MFKNAIILTYTSQSALSLEQVESALQAQPFAPCGPTQDKSIGWAPPRGQAHGAFVESIGRQWIARFMVETKTVPTSTVNRQLQDRVAEIDQREGRKPGRKESREIREDIIQHLLPNAFPKTVGVSVWIDPQTQRIVLDVPSIGKTDEIVTSLVRFIPGLEISLLNTHLSPQAAMTSWLLGGKTDAAPEGLAVGRYVELKSADETRSLVKFDRHHLDDEQMKLHIGQGKLPTQLALQWDGRVSFVLTDGLVIKKIAFMDDVFEDRGDGDAGFDGDAAIATAELAKVINLDRRAGRRDGLMDIQISRIFSDFDNNSEKVKFSVKELTLMKNVLVAGKEDVSRSDAVSLAPAAVQAA